MKAEIFTKFHGEINGVEFDAPNVYSITARIIRRIESMKDVQIENEKFTAYVRDKVERGYDNGLNGTQMELEVRLLINENKKSSLWNNFNEKYEELIGGE